MRCRLIFTTLGLLFALILSAQEEISVEAEWRTYDINNSDYQRVISKSPEGKFLVKDYYITGELLMEGCFSYVDPDNPKKDIPDGQFVWYFKSGSVKKRSNYVNGVEEGLQITFYESGNKAVEMCKRDGLTDGELLEYYESGQLRRISFFCKGAQCGEVREYYPNGVVSKSWYLENGLINGLLTEYNECGRKTRVYEFASGISSPYSIDYDEIGVAVVTFDDDFQSQELGWYWGLASGDPRQNIPFSVIKGRGLFMDSKSDSQSLCCVRVPLESSADFLIESAVTFVTGSDSLFCGLVWGLKDLNNYCYFLIASNGLCRGGTVSDGVYSDLFRTNKSDIIIRHFESNKMSVIRNDGRVKFILNGNEVSSYEHIAHQGDKVGMFMEGKRALVFKNLKIRQKTHLK